MQLTVQETPTQAIERVKAKIHIRSRYENFIGGKWVAPVEGRSISTTPRRSPARPSARSPARRPRTSSLRSTPRTRPRTPGASTSPAKRAAHPEQDRRPHGRESSRCSRPSRPSTTASRSARRSPPTSRSPSTTSAISPAACAPRKARICEIDDDTVAYHFHEPLGVVGQIIPWNFPHPDGGVEARARARRRQLRRAEAGRADADVDHGADGPDRRPPAARRAQRGQRLRRRGRQAARPNKRIAKIAFTGETTTGRLIMQYASREPHPGHARARRQVAQHLLRRRDGARTTTSSTRRSKASPCSR